jgi:hypothetical protein
MKLKRFRAPQNGELRNRCGDAEDRRYARRTMNSVRWGRTWANHATYVHPYPGLQRYTVAARPEHHELIKRREAERNAAARVTNTTRNTATTTDASAAHGS